tara:strand:+ start:2847 stop:3539 length:693 start_codon:yes stop_codon:yes gene_type:complete
VARFLTTIPNNLGFFNLGKVESYPTGGGGPTAYGPTSYFGSDPRPAEQGDNLNNPIDLGDFSAIFKNQIISNSHGGLTRKQSTFYKINLSIPRSIQFTQEFSRTSYEDQTNRNTLIAFYKIDENKHRQELPINDDGYVFHESSIDSEDDDTGAILSDYPSIRLEKGNYLFVITNDIRYIETTYSIGLNVSVLDWRFVFETVEEQINLGLITQSIVDSTGASSGALNFGFL